MTTSDKTIDYFFSVISPWTFFGDLKFRAMAEKYGYQINHYPQLSPVLFPATGGLPLKDRAAPRQAYRMMELERWSKYLGVAINLRPKFFPAAEAPASKLIIAARDAGHDVGDLTHAIGRAVWQEDRDISDTPTLVSIADACGLDGAALIAESADEAYDKKLHAESLDAIERGVFGYPTYALKNDLYWGQDRLDFVERALQQA